MAQVLTTWNKKLSSKSSTVAGTSEWLFRVLGWGWQLQKQSSNYTEAKLASLVNWAGDHSSISPCPRPKRPGPQLPCHVLSNSSSLQRCNTLSLTASSRRRSVLGTLRLSSG